MRKFELFAEGHRKQDSDGASLLKLLEYKGYLICSRSCWKYSGKTCLIPLNEIQTNPGLLDSDPTNNCYR